MIHFTMFFSNDASNSPFVRTLESRNIPYKVFSKLILFRHKRRWQLILIGWPKLLYSSIITGIKSLVLSKPRPDVVVLENHLEALVFCLIRYFVPYYPKIVIRGFIFTPRKSAFLNTIRMMYFRFIFSQIDLVICYSNLEMERSKTLFKGCKAEFSYCPYGLHMADSEFATPMTLEEAKSKGYIFSAGRSSRDYATLINAVRNLEYDLKIACDVHHEAFHKDNLSSSITILDGCYDDAYVETLKHARCVVIPLSVDDISAGQMVMMQAMAFGRPLIVTQTSTINEYIKEPGGQAILVAQGDAHSLENAIRRVMDDPELSCKLSRKAWECYVQNYSMKAYVNNLVNLASRLT